MSDDVTTQSGEGSLETVDERVHTFWEVASAHARLNGVPAYFGPNVLDSVPPPAWSFGTGAEEADNLLALVLAGTKTATASAQWDYAADNEPLPEPGALSIILAGTGQPRALIETTDVEIVPFDQVTEEHARLEGEGDLSLDYWREVHEKFFREVATHAHGFVADMPVVCERFRVLYSE
ncbi:ASCH domain-containing protein [Knoellia sp. Soil729]|uniref:ASCH domain-containing protein n=1 Tax=Knoellia sp. Soil729 TaxID=1736394 RepID=UPI0006F927FF|nr:ASCH domain-containing protein [Knoellia sp. Soil729]KRE42265.1 ASCH domain-containing protein [Knoellia sp. Soil729]